MHPEIEYLINMALADGQVTEKEKAIILRKAESLNLDKDEVEMILDGRIALSNRESLNSQGASISRDNTEGQSEKCPLCGSPISSFNTICSDCGHEFRNTQAASSIQRLYDQMQKIEESERSRERSWAQKIDGDLGVQKSVATRQASAISSFPVPNAREDLLEFLSIASSEANKKLSLFIMHAHPDAVLKKAWRTKCEQVIIKSRLSMKEDKRTLEEIESYARQLGIK